MQPVTEIDWKRLYSERFLTDKMVAQELDSIIAFQSCRTQKQKTIIDVGLDAKEVLLENLSIGDEASDILARRWYSSHTLGCLNRSIAVDQWAHLREPSGEVITLETALAAFDVFVLEDGSIDTGDISYKFDGFADKFRQHDPSFQDLDQEKQAVAVIKYLRNHHLVGIDKNVDLHYHDLANNFIGEAISGKTHRSLPLISVAIFCSVAQRLGLNAQPCGFPFHVLAVVQPDSTQSSIAGDLEKPIPRSPIYLDPFRSNEEVPLETLESQLISMGVPSNDHERLLSPASTADIVSRCARNIITSVQTLPRSPAADSVKPGVEVSFYAALWALLLLPSGNENEVSMMQQAWYLPRVLRLVAGQYATDTWLVEKHLVPKIEQFGSSTAQTLRDIRATADARKPKKARDSQATRNVRYRIGHVFRHKRYQYYAIIYGWDATCSAEEDWMVQMRVDDLPRGRKQSFYHALVDDKSTRYVAEDHIEIVRDEAKHDLMAIAGQYFKRWDPEDKAFISNIRDEYPND
ncbi:uncharacterized protein KY384_005896 [Bacidia gigantensis]|uniref:uncharacterized protein n=1 Tax=Bacidia gigantensis TaxID=2732470 RepID=UPI001D04FF3E|nr:uncharacterized protein KY384_005896 [Bacidia gigantensis]KAG8529261.1 hypothetical protein KY384_005896 [Bacidia gigantensis]